jgi:hypothetical protein
MPQRLPLRSLSPFFSCLLGLFISLFSSASLSSLFSSASLSSSSFLFPFSSPSFNPLSFTTQHHPAFLGRFSFAPLLNCPPPSSNNRALSLTPRTPHPPGGSPHRQNRCRSKSAIKRPTGGLFLLPRQLPTPPHHSSSRRQRRSSMHPTMEHNYSNPHVAPPPASLPHPMQYQRSPQSQYPMPDSEPRPLFGSGQQQPYPHPQQLPYPQPHYDHGMPYGQPQSPQSPHYPPPQTVQLPPMSTAVPQHYNVPYTMDTTGQVPPPGMRPRLTTSIFEEEGSLCFQVDVNGICVARREGNPPGTTPSLIPTPL